MICRRITNAKMFNFYFAAFCVLLTLSMTTHSQSQAGYVPPQWQTTAEKTDYKQTSTYDEAIAYSKKLSAASGGLIIYTHMAKAERDATCRC